MVIEPSFGILKRITYFSPAATRRRASPGSKSGRFHRNAGFASSPFAPCALFPGVPEYKNMGRHARVLRVSRHIRGRFPCARSGGKVRWVRRCPDLHRSSVQPVQPVDQFLFPPQDKSFLVGIFYPQDEGPAGAACQQEGIQAAARRSKMHASGGRWGEAGTNRFRIQEISVRNPVACAAMQQILPIPPQASAISIRCRRN